MTVGARDAPSSLILKMGHLDNTGRPSYANRREIAFYRDVVPVMRERVAPHCFETVDATDNSTWHLLLEDLTQSHFIATEWPLPPTLEKCESVAQGQARLHAGWWDNPSLGASVGICHDADAFDRYLPTRTTQIRRPAPSSAGPGQFAMIKCDFAIRCGKPVRRLKIPPSLLARAD